MRKIWKKDGPRLTRVECQPCAGQLKISILKLYSLASSEGHHSIKGPSFEKIINDNLKRPVPKAFLTLNVVWCDRAMCLKLGRRRTCLVHGQNVADDPDTDCDCGEGAMPPLQCSLGLGLNSVIGGTLRMRVSYVEYLQTRRVPPALRIAIPTSLRATRLHRHRRFLAGTLLKLVSAFGSVLLQPGR